MVVYDSDTGVFQMTRGDYAPIRCGPYVRDPETDERTPYVMQPLDTITLTVRETADTSYPILLQITSQPGSDRLVILSQDTKDIPPGKYSADLQLNIDGGPQAITFWPEPPEKKRNQGAVYNFENFIINAEVTD